MSSAVAAVVFAVSVVGTVCAAVWQQHVPHFPCDVSQTGTAAPEYWLFAGGLSTAALVIASLHVRFDSGAALALGLLGCCGVSGLGVFDTNTYFRTHSAFALTCFVSFLSYVHVTGAAADTWWLAAGVCAYGFRLVTAPIATQHWDVFGVRAHPNGSAAQALRIERYVVFLKFRSLCQWLAIASLFVTVLSRFSALEAAAAATTAAAGAVKT